MSAHANAASIAESFLDTEQLAAMIGRSPRTVERDRLFGRGPRYVKYGRHVRYPLSAVNEYLQSLPTGGGAPLPGAGA